MHDRGRLVDRRPESPRGVMLALLLAALALAGTIVGCDRPADQPAAAAPTGAAPAVAVATSIGSPVRADAPTRLAPTVQASPIPAEPLMALVSTDAARRTGTDPERVRIVQIEAREWPDRSLGCPRPGMGYAQAITPGYLIVAEAAGQRLEYHTDRAQVVLCPS